MQETHTTVPVSAINELTDLCYSNSRAHGFWDDESAGVRENTVMTTHQKIKSVPEKLALIHSEVSEALEAYRDKQMDTEVNRESGKPEGFPSELADIVIRVCDLAGALGIDLGDEIAMKVRYNISRPRKHGKVC